MAKTIPFEAERRLSGQRACGRSIQEEKEAIYAYGNHGVSPVLRNAILAAHGISNPREKASVAIFFGCYRPFTTPFLLSDYIKLLDLLGVSYTFFDKEYCCGLPLLTSADNNNLEESKKAIDDFNTLNIDLARKKEASTSAYCCISCAYVAKSKNSADSSRYVYMPDVLFSALEHTKLRIRPMTIGYFGGCHTFYKHHFPGVELGWERYRAGLEKIEGLKIVDLPDTLCCKRASEKIVQSAWERNLDTIVCPCNGCHAALAPAAAGKARMLSLPALLLEALATR